jgi:gliding motility-associated-like protein
MKKILTLIFTFGFLASLLAQKPANDECEGAIFIPDVKSFCSAFGSPTFSTVNATPSGFGAATCIPTVGNDVWFSFIPLAKDVNIVIKGQVNTKNVGGTMKFPQAALYSGDCKGQLTEWECQKDNNGIGLINLYQGGLEIGTQYFIRIQASTGGGGKDGTFQMCIDNYNPPKVPQGDCPDASLLCDKSTFVVQAVTGFGKDGKEIKPSDAACFDGGLGGPSNVEMSSTWYKWTCEKTGTLTFTLTPLKENDDIDFILFELPGGIDDCANKFAVRCMACGDSQFPSPCMGPTGLRDGETDLSESAGCGPGKNSFIAPLDMVVGKSYALMVNNFTSTGTGFKMDFGGTSTFLGPTVKFSTTAKNSVCFGKSLEYQDESFYVNGTIKKWSWNFGQGATPAKLEETIKPSLHAVKYNSPGKKYVSLSLETNKGCIVTEILAFEVDSCCKTDNKINNLPTITDLTCSYLLDGVIDLKPKEVIPTTYSWELGQKTSKIEGLGAGTYKVTISNAATCDTIINYTVKSPPPILVDTLLKKPTCNGGKDGIITLLPNGGNAPYEFDFGKGFSLDNTLKNLPIGLYKSFIKDKSGCLKAIDIDLKELELDLNPTVKAAKPPLCFGSKNGEITLSINNGKSPFLYDFGTGFQNSNSITNLASGTYNVTVQDDNNCKGKFKFVLDQPEKIVLATDTSLISCYGANDGKASVDGKGGTGAYSFAWDDDKKQINSQAIGLAPKNYTVTVTDENGCTETAQVGLAQPPKLDITATVKDVGCFNDRTGELVLLGNGGRPPYKYSLDGVIFQKSTNFKGLPFGTYSLIVKDTAGCEYQISQKINQPSPFIVNAGSDQVIELGESANIFAETFPIGKNVKSYLWTPDSTLTCRDCPNPTSTPFKTITYLIKAVDETGCPAQDKVTIIVTKLRRIFPPNVFSPGDDNGLNDKFTLFSDRSAKQVQLMRVFDRWGTLIYEGQNFPTNDTKFGWDGTYRGKKAEVGVYTWTALVEFIDGEVLTYKGDILLVR